MIKVYDGPMGAVVVLPLGATEQHGVHLPVSTDTVLASAVISRAMSAMNQHIIVSMRDATAAQCAAADIVIAPELAISASGEHQGFPGVLSVGTKVARMMIVETIRSALLWASHVVVVNAHGGNMAALHEIERDLQSGSEGASVFHCRISTGSRDLHAGQGETSAMLAICAGVVGEHEEIEGVNMELRELFPQLQQYGVQGVSPNGILGDPRFSTAELGNTLLQRESTLLHDHLAHVLEQVRQQ